MNLVSSSVRAGIGPERPNHARTNRRCVTNHAMRVLLPPESAGWGVLDPQDGVALPLFRGRGTEDYQCGGCNVTILEHIPTGVRFGNMAVKCPTCATVSAFEPV
jgi:hypothetical protein